MSSEMRDLIAKWRDEAANPDSHIPAAGLLYCADALEALLEDDDEECPHTMKSQDRDGSVMCCDCGTLLARTEAGADGDKAARDLYVRWVDSQDVHCNRFPSWQELSDARKQEWRAKLSPFPPRLQAAIDRVNTRPQDASGDAERAMKYEELIYAVGNKYPGETRHETALRYIRQAESHVGSEGCVAMQAKEAK